MAKEIGEEYASSLADLTVNSKPLINMLTILAEENIDHAGIIVETVEKHLEKVQPEIKLPVLYLVDSIIKNVGGEYTQKFSQSIVNMFTKTFKQVDEKTRSQMFKLRETWHEVFPGTKLYQLDVKVSLIDPAWPIQAQPQAQQSNIHLNPNFLKKPASTANVAVASPITPTEDEEKMKIALARKEQELLMLQRKKIEMELEHTKRQLELAERSVQKVDLGPPQAEPPFSTPTSVVEPVSVPVTTLHAASAAIPVKQRLGPPVNKSATTSNIARIAPVSGAMLSTVRRDPRLARHQPPSAALPTQPHIVSNIFDIKPLERPLKITKRKNVITIDVRTDDGPAVPADVTRDPRGRRDPRLQKSLRTGDFDDRPRRPDPRDKVRARGHGKMNKKNADALLNRRRDMNQERQNTNRRYNNDIPSKLSEDNDKPSNVNINPDESVDLDSQSPSKMKKVVEEVIPRFLVADSKKINKLPPIPKINKHDDSKNFNNKKVNEAAPSPNKRKKEGTFRTDKKPNKKNKDNSDSSSSPEKKSKEIAKESKKLRKDKNKEQPMDTDNTEKPAENEVVTFKELKNYHKERYMRRNKEKSESPEKIIAEESPIDKEDSQFIGPSSETEGTNIVDEKKDIDLRVLAPVAPEITKPAAIGHKRPSTEAAEHKNVKKPKLDKFDILFGNEDVDLRQLPQVDDSTPATSVQDTDMSESPGKQSPLNSPKQKDWTDIKDNQTSPECSKKSPSHLDLVRAKLAEATKGKDRLGRQLLFSTLPGDKERRRTISTEDTDLRVNNVNELNNAKNDKESIKIIISQAEEQYKEGNINKEQYNTLMFQVMQLNERLKLKEAKQRESLEESKRKLHKAHISDEDVDANSPKRDNTFGDIDERVVPTAYINKDSVFPELPKPYMSIAHNDIGSTSQDSDLRVPNMGLDHPNDIGLGMIGPNMHMPRPMFMGPSFPPMWRGPRPRLEEFNGPRGGRPRGPVPSFFRGKFDKRGNRNFDLRMPMPPLPPPSLGMYQGECPIKPYDRPESPIPLGTPGVGISPTDFRVLEYIDQDPMKTIDIDGIPREIRFYGETAVVLLDWDDPREIKFLPGTRRITFDNKDSIVLGFNEDYITAEIEEQIFNIRFGSPTRELFINQRWYECFFGGPPCGIVIDGNVKLIHLEGPPPQVDIGKEKRTDLVAGKINMIVDAQHMCPIFLDAKPQKFDIDGNFFTIRFVDALKTVLINETAFKVEFGGLPRPIFIGKNKHFIRFSVLPRNVRPGHIKIANMEGRPPTESVPKTPIVMEDNKNNTTEDDQEELPLYERVLLSPEGDNSNSGGLDVLASVMPSSMAPPSQFSGYSMASPLISSNSDNKIPGLDTPAEEYPPTAPGLPFFGSINVNDLFAKLVATGIVQTPTTDTKQTEESRQENKKVEEARAKVVKEDKSIVKRVDLLKSETLRGKQPGIVSRLYGGMQCSGCGTRFPPEHTVKYSQHLDWHFRQNRRERDSARRAHSRHWHYDLSDWVQYEEIEDLEDREKSWFETSGAEGESEVPVEVPEGEPPSVPAGAPQDQFCALCGDKFDQFYNEDKEEWHLRKAVRHEDNNYHPLCFEDLKISLTKEEAIEIKESTTDETSVIIIEKDDAPIEIKDVDDDAKSQSDNESVVEVIESGSQKDDSQEPVEIDEGDEDDVVLKAEPVDEVVVEDDADTDDETQAERAERDRLVGIDFANIKVKQEPIDPDDEPVITSEEEPMRATVDTTSTTVLSSIDGNVQLESRNMVNPIGSIKFNISKLPSAAVRSTAEDRAFEDITADDEPLPPGEEPELDYKLKPSLEGVQLSRQPPVQRGIELSGLCSIM